MAPRESTRTLTKATTDTAGPPPELSSQRKRPERGPFCLQVDRQTKASYATYEAAEKAGLVVKKGHPILHVEVWDIVGGVNKVVDLPE